jgi:hypothetical protein
MRAQQHDSALSDGEVEKLREVAPFYPERVMAFVGFLNERAERIEKLSSGKRQPGREEDLHELIQQMGSILDDLADNLDEYSKYHRDVRKALPKLVAASERWGTALRSVAEDQEYNVALKLTLESLKDVHEEAVQLVEEQKAWFSAHPPNGSDKKGSKDPGN